MPCQFELQSLNNARFPTRCGALWKFRMAHGASSLGLMTLGGSLSALDSVQTRSRSHHSTRDDCNPHRSTASLPAAAVRRVSSRSPSAHSVCVRCRAPRPRRRSASRLQPCAPCSSSPPPPPPHRPTEPKLFGRVGQGQGHSAHVAVVEVEVEVSRGLYRIGCRRRAIAPSFYRGCPSQIGPCTALPCSPPRPQGAHP